MRAFALRAATELSSNAITAGTASSSSCMANHGVLLAMKNGPVTITVVCMLHQSSKLLFRYKTQQDDGILLSPKEGKTTNVPKTTGEAKREDKEKA